MMKLRPIAVPKFCRQRRSARVKRRRLYGSFNWTHFSSDPLEQGCMHLCSSYKDYSPSIVDRKMDLIFGARAHDVSQKGDTMFTERENKANILKRLERPLTELESATQSTISDSTESGYMGENGCYTFAEYHSSEMCNSGNNSCAAADTHHWNQKKPDSGTFIEGKHGSTKTARCFLWSVDSFEKSFSQRMDTEDTLEEAVTKNSLNDRENCDKRYQSSYPSKQNPYSGLRRARIELEDEIDATIGMVVEEEEEVQPEEEEHVHTGVEDPLLVVVGVRGKGIMTHPSSSDSPITPSSSRARFFGG